MSNDLDYDHLHKQLSKILGGKLSGKEELAQIVAEAASELHELQQTNPQAEEDYIAYLLDILQYTHDTSYAYLAEPYLKGPRDFLAAQALILLCHYYDLTERYVDYILKFIRGVEWDPMDDLQHRATLIAGHYLEKHTHIGLLSELIRIVEDASGSNARPSFPFLTTERRELAYAALVDALGKPSEIGGFNIDEIDPAIVDEAKERLKQEELHGHRMPEVC